MAKELDKTVERVEKFQRLVDKGATGLSKNVEAGKRVIAKLKARKGHKIEEIEKLKNQ